MRRIAELLPLVVLLAAVSAGSLGAADVRVSILTSADGVSADGPVSWLDGGFGKLTGGDATPGSTEEVGTLGLQAGALVSFDESWSAWAHILARSDSGTATEGELGLTELWLETARNLAGGRIRARAGMMFLPTSRENVGELWSSPYLISLSTINSWIAEEVRPTGIDVDYRLQLRPGYRLRAAATAFGGNDTAGTLLGWRGWASGGRLSVLNEELPLPPLPSFSTSFPAQKSGTTPLGEDLDGRAGWSARVRFDAPRGIVTQWTRYDSRGDRALHDDEYSWRTSFDLFGLEFHPVESLTFAAEHMRGDTGMGFAPGDAVDARFVSTYALLSWQLRKLRLSSRVDWFETSERDFSGAENNDEDGSAVAVAAILEPLDGWSVAVEINDLRADRASARSTLGTSSLDGRSVLLRLRYLGMFD
ncbi:MAG: hypothetical protein NDJ92_07775 [Thermoanaerobaculia bacterium]|nr:hypothetical protein [Thermoanaerobaculia bacterium]